MNKVKDVNKAGLISFKMSISNDPTLDFKKFESWKKAAPVRAQPVIVRAYIYQCRDLPSADDDGACDPYLHIWDMGDQDPKSKHRKKTKTI